jgi:hypothetical protein
VAYNGWYLSRSVGALEVEVVRGTMIEQVAMVAREAQAIRRKTGELPPATDLGALLGEGMTYEVSGAYFRIGAVMQEVAVSYHSSVDLDLWQTGSRGTP